MSKKRAWLEEYFKCWNATEAARQVGYKWPEKIGPRNKLLLQSEIDARLDEMAIPANEVLARLGEISRADVSYFIDVTGGIRWDRVHEKGYLIKSITHTKGRQAKIELHDSQSALQHLDKYHGGSSGQAIPDQVEVKIREIVVEHLPDESLED
jgi:hypothetical protein